MLIAHFSDLHINTNIKKSKLAETERLIKYAIKQKADHITITGDLSDHSFEEDFSELRNLFGSYDLLHPSKLSIVIGNHDIFGGVEKLEDIFTFPDKCRNVDYQNKVDNFIHYFKEAHLSEHNTQITYPYSKIINQTLIIGLNSIDNYSSLKNPFASNGIIEGKQYDEVDEILSKFRHNAEHAVILLHHHLKHPRIFCNKWSKTFWQGIEKQTMKLRNKKQLFRLFNDYNVDIILHGHIHESIEYYRRGVRCFNGGAAIHNRSNDLLINLIKIKSKKIETETVLVNS